MAPHIKQRMDRSGTWYLVDGRINKSLKTRVRRLAQARLEQYIRGKFDLGPKVTVGDYFDRWIETKKEPLVRRSLALAYRQHFRCYILSGFRELSLRDLTAARLSAFLDSLVGKGLSLKTVKNIIAGSFRALWRDAMREELVNHDPFVLIDWPRVRRNRPEPYTVAERDAILSYLLESDRFYYPFVRFQFETGCRPSEAVALRWSDIDVRGLCVSITKSRHLGADSAPKTSGSVRRIVIGRDLMAVVTAMRLPWHTEESHVFYNKHSGGPLEANQWTRVYWKGICAGAEVAHRKFYATRHTSITEAVKQPGSNLLAIAQYHGTSVEMIQRNYCGPLELNQTVLQPAVSKSLNYVVVPAGIEPALPT